MEAWLWLLSVPRTGILFRVALPARVSASEQMECCLPLDPKPQAACLPRGMGHPPPSRPTFLLLDGGCLEMGFLLGSAGGFVEEFLTAILSAVYSKCPTLGWNLPPRAWSLIWLGSNSTGRSGRSPRRVCQCLLPRSGLACGRGRGCSEPIPPLHSPPNP